MRMTLLLSFLLLGACDDAKDDTAVGDTDADTDADSDADTDADTDADGNSAFSGTIVWEGGAAAEGVQVRLCLHSCRTQMSDSGGHFAFTGLEADTHTLQLVKLGDAEYATPNALVTLAEDEQREASDPMLLPAFTDSTTLTTAGSVTGGDLLAVADPDGMTFGSYCPIPDETSFSVVRVDPGAAGLPLDGIVGDVVGMWYLGNFDSYLDPRWSFTTQVDLGLVPDESLEIYAVSNTDHVWLSGGTATVNADGYAVSDGGSGIPALTTLVLVRPPTN